MIRGRIVAWLIPFALAAAPLQPVHAAPQWGYDSLVAHVRSANVVLHYPPGSPRLAQRLVEQIESAPPLPGLPAELLIDPPVHVYLAADEQAFGQLAGGRPPEWGAGVALLSRNRIVLPGYATQRVSVADLPRVLRHELAHVALHRYLQNTTVPRWFHEGYSRWAAGEFDVDAAWRLRIAFAFQQAPSLDSLTLDWPAGRADARVAYLLAASTIDYLVEAGGERGLHLFLERWKRGGDLDQAMRQTYGVTIGQFEEDWRRRVRDRYGWGVLVTHSMVFWLFASIALLWLYVERRRRDRHKMDELRRSEPPDDPAYWLEGSDEHSDAEG